MKKVCSRCKKKCRAEELIDWMDELETLSPKFCPKCYAYILDHWNPDDPIGDIENLE